MWRLTDGTAHLVPSSTGWALLLAAMPLSSECTAVGAADMAANDVAAAAGWVTGWLAADGSSHLSPLSRAKGLCGMPRTAAEG
jgi:hypothetical protein